MQDTMLYDGDQQRYLQLLANGGEEETNVDASDIDSSDVASSNEIESDSDSDEDQLASDRMRSSVLRSQGRGKRGRSAIGSDAEVDANADDRNPLIAEIASKSERRQAATQRWFNDPLFAEVDEAEPTATVEGDDVVSARPGEDGGLDDSNPDMDEENETRPSRKRARGDGGKDGKGTRGRRGVEEHVGGDGDEQMGEAAALLKAMPKTDKEKRKEKRKKVRWSEQSEPTVGAFRSCGPSLHIRKRFAKTA